MICGLLRRRPRGVAGVVWVVHAVVVVALESVGVLLAAEGLPVAHGQVVVGVRLVAGAPVGLGGDLANRADRMLFSTCRLRWIR